MKIFPFSLIFLILGAAPTMGCDLCALYIAAQARGETRTGFYLGVAEQFIHFATLQNEGRKVPNELNQHLDSIVSQVLLGYNFADWFGVQLNLPLIYRSFQRPEGFEIQRGTESG